MGVVAAGVLATVALTGSISGARASEENGVMDVHATTVLSPYPCPGGGCSNTFAAISSGYLAGVDDTGAPFEVDWSAPEGGVSNMQLTLVYGDGCFSPLDVIPSSNSLSGSFTIGSAVGYYKGVKTTGSVDGSFVAAREYDVAQVGELFASITIGGTTIPFNIRIAEGVLNLTPVGTDSCSNTQQKFDVDGTLLTLL